MKVCHCTLGGTRACMACPNNPMREWSAYPLYPQPYYPFMPLQPQQPIDYQKLAEEVAKIMKQPSPPTKE